MEHWRKHPKDVIEGTVHGNNQVMITTCKRHRKDGKFQGYIVSVIDQKGYKEKYFKRGYFYRDCVVMLALIDYTLFTGTKIYLGK